MKNHQSHSVLPDIALLRLPEVLKLYPVSRSTWWAGVRTGRFPQPVKLGERCTAWRYKDVRDLIEQADNASTEA